MFFRKSGKLNWQSTVIPLRPTETATWLLRMRTIIVHCYICKIARFPQSASPSVWKEKGFPRWKILRRGRPAIMPRRTAQYPLQWGPLRLHFLRYSSIVVPVEVFFSYLLLWRRPDLSTYSYLRVPRCILSSLRGQHSVLQRHFCGGVKFPICDSALTLYLKSFSCIVCFCCSTQGLPFMRRT